MRSPPEIAIIIFTNFDLLNGDIIIINTTPTASTPFNLSFIIFDYYSVIILYCNNQRTINFFYLNLDVFICNFNHYLGYLGLEPRTNRLKAEYSTIELATLI